MQIPNENRKMFNQINNINKNTFKKRINVSLVFVFECSKQNFDFMFYSQQRLHYPALFIINEVRVLHLRCIA